MTSSLPTLCSFDFDGTLIDKYYRPSFEPQLGEFLCRLRERGGHWVINTGRSLDHTLEGLLDHGVMVAGQILAPDFIIAREHLIYTRGRNGQWVDLGEWNARCQRQHDIFYHSHRRFFEEVRDFTENGGRGVWIEEEGDPAGIITRTEKDMAEVIDFIENRRGNWPELGYQRNTVYLRFTHRDFGKGSSLAELGRQLGLGPQSIFAAGDNFNDLSMLRREIAHHLVCPANALPEVQQQVLAEGGRVASLPASRGLAEALAEWAW